MISDTNYAWINLRTAGLATEPATTKNTNLREYSMVCIAATDFEREREREREREKMFRCNCASSLPSMKI